jgi:predicted ATPase/DNA-binding SARP family transcriptional activator
MNASMLKFRLFGPLVVEQDGQSLPLPASAQARDLLAYLALFHERKHTRSLLIGTFWPEMSEERARRALSQALWQIRRFFPDLVTAEVETVRFAPPASFQVDALDFERLAKAAFNIAPQETIRQELEQALALYRADFLEGNYHDWVLLERERLRELYLQALERLGQLEKSSGHYARALDLALRLSGAEPFNEAAHREIMRLHHLLGQPEAAARQFELCRDILRRELDVEPSPETLAVVEEINHLSEREASANKTDRESLIPTPLVGREADRSALLQFLEGIFHKLGGLVLLEGEAGVGKTRLLQDIARDAEWRGAQVLWGSAQEAQGLKPYTPLVQALQAGLTPLRITQIQQVVERVWLQAILPLLAPHPALPTLEAAPSLPPAQEQARLVEAVVRLLEGWAGITPLVILLEDLHWADQDTLHLLPALARRLTPFGVLLICSYRSEEARADAQVWEALQAVSRRGMLERRVLPRLDEQATGELIRRSLGLASAAPLFEERLYHETDGNPLFVLETLRALQGEGLLHQEADGGWSTPWDESTSNYAELPLAPLIEQAISRRVEQLPVHLCRVLNIAAVFGAHLDFRLLNAASGLETESLLQAIRELRHLRFLEEVQEGYRFHHDLIRQVILARMDEAERLQRHQDAARFIEAIRPEQVEELAFHFTEGHVWEKAVQYHQQAGLQAARAFAYASALAHYDQAVSLSEFIGRPAGSLFDLHAGREKILDTLGNREAQNDAVQAMLGLAGKDPRKLCQAHLRRAWLLAETSHYEEAQAEARLSLELGKNAGDLLAQAEALNTLGTAFTWQGKTAEAAPALNEAIALVRQAQDVRAQARYRRALASALLGIREYDAAQKEAETSLEQAAQQNDPLEQAEVFNLLGIIHMEHGDPETARGMYEQSLLLSRKAGYLYGEGRALTNLGNLYYFQGQLSKTLDCYAQAIGIFASLEEKRGEVQLRLNRASISLNMLGNTPQLIEDAQFALEYAIRTDDPLSKGQALTVLAEAERQNGDYKTAREHLVQGIQAMEAGGDLWLLTQEYRTLGILDIEEKRPQEALENLEHALSICRERGLASMEAPIIAIRGLALLQQGRLNEALQATSEAVSRWKSDVEQGYLLYYWHAQVLHSLGRPEEAQASMQKAYELLESALAGLSAEQRSMSYENIPEHRAILAAWQETRPPQVTAQLPQSGESGKTVTVTWTPFAAEDNRIPSKVARRRHRLQRLLEEARAQGAAPTQRDLAEALGVGLRTIERDMASKK